MQVIVEGKEPSHQGDTVSTQATTNTSTLWSPRVVVEVILKIVGILVLLGGLAYVALWIFISVAFRDFGSNF